VSKTPKNYPNHNHPASIYQNEQPHQPKPQINQLNPNTTTYSSISTDKSHPATTANTVPTFVSSKTDVARLILKCDVE
jgi:hypothetical protein